MNISSLVRLSMMIVLLAHAAAHAQSDSIPRGQIVERVEALNDRSQSYALYLPSNYTPDQKWPVLYAFDPGARGRVPVERFKEAAEKYGWIVLGSNDSRNAMITGNWDDLVTSNVGLAMGCALAFLVALSTKMPCVEQRTRINTD